jgi:anti-anti-sigma factor
MSQLSAVPDPTADFCAGPFECTVSAAGRRAAWIHAAGALDLSSSPQLERALRAAQLHARLVVLDTREVSFIDCSGVHAILAANAGADWGVPRLILVPGPAVERLLKVAGAFKQIWTFDVDPPAELQEPALAPSWARDGA